MTDVNYEQGIYRKTLEGALHPLRDHIWVVTESDGQLNHKALAAFFSEQDAADFIEHQNSLYPDKIFGVEREFWAFTRRLFESRNKFLEALAEKSKAITRERYMCGKHCSSPVYALRHFDPNPYHEDGIIDVAGVFTDLELAEEEREKYLAYYGGIDILPMNPDRTICPLAECPTCMEEQGDEWTPEGLVG